MFLNLKMAKIKMKFIPCYDFGGISDSNPLKSTPPLVP